MTATIVVGNGNRGRHLKKADDNALEVLIGFYRKGWHRARLGPFTKCAEQNRTCIILRKSEQVHVYDRRQHSCGLAFGDANWDQLALLTLRVLGEPAAHSDWVYSDCK